MDEPAWAELEAIVSDALATRPAKLQRQLLLFIRIVEWLPLARFGRRFTRLGPSRRIRVLRGLQDAPSCCCGAGVGGCGP